MSTTTENHYRTTKANEAVVATVDEMQAGTMKMARVGEQQVVVARTSTGFHALDNACPHQGYGLATGTLDGELLTCQWHNWKFDVNDGRCVLGEEDVACHAVRIEGDEVIVSITPPSREEQLARLWPSLLRGIERDYRGQIARDTARLLQAGAAAEEIVAVALRHALPRSEWGLGHEMAVTADLLALSDGYDDLDKTLPLAHALSSCSEGARDRPLRAAVEPAATAADQEVFVDAVEQEDAPQALGALATLFETRPHDEAVAEARRWFIDAVSRHHYDYGHGAIYTQKAFALIERLPALTTLLLSELAQSLIYGTREDTLPYMRKANRAIDAVDLDALTAVIPAPRSDRADTERLVDVLLEADEAPIVALVEAAHDGAGVPGIIDVVSLAASKRMLRYDLSNELDNSEEFGWLDLTHALTYANAARWAWHTEPGPRSARLVLLTAFLAFDAGRHERRAGLTSPAFDYPSPLEVSSIYTVAGDMVAAAVLEQRPAEAVTGALAGEASSVATALERVSLEDLAGSAIVMVHVVKLSVAARHEAAATGSNLPLAAAARFAAAPRKERFVARGANEAIEFIRTGRPPKR